MKDLSSDLLFAQLEFLMSAYKETDINLTVGSTYSIADDRGADLLRLLNMVTSELVARIDLPF